MIFVGTTRVRLDLIVYFGKSELVCLFGLKQSLVIYLYSSLFEQMSGFVLCLFFTLLLSHLSIFSLEKIADDEN